MDEQIKAAYDKWFASYMDAVPNAKARVEEPEEWLKNAFAEGYAQGVVSMMDKMGAVIAKAGEVTVTKIDRESFTKAQSESQRDIGLRNVGNILAAKRRKNRGSEESGGDVRLRAAGRAEVEMAGDEHRSVRKLRSDGGATKKKGRR